MKAQFDMKHKIREDIIGDKKMWSKKQAGSEKSKLKTCVGGNCREEAE